MEIWTVSKSQPDQRADNSRCPQMVLQCSEKFPHRLAYFSWPRNKKYTSSVIMDVKIKSELYIKETEIKNHSRLTKTRGDCLVPGANMRRGSTCFWRSEPSHYTSIQCRQPHKQVHPTIIFIKMSCTQSGIGQVLSYNLFLCVLLCRFGILLHFSVSVVSLFSSYS